MSWWSPGPRHPVLAGLITIVALGLGYLWVAVAGVLEADATPDVQAAANDQRVIAGAGAIALLAAGVLAWLGRWWAWIAAQAVPATLLVAWLIVADPLGV